MIYEQLSDYCDCIKEVTDSDIDELISLVSMATCWTNTPCETFLSSERREVIDLEDCLDDCEIVRFAPYYAPFDPDSFRFTLVKEVGIEETLIPVTEFTYSEIDGVFKLAPPIPSCSCSDECVCTCNPKYKLVIDYVAGYEELPECLLPIFCEALQYVVERRKCDCSQCQKCEEYDDDKVEVLVENAATITNQLKAYFVTTLTKQYTRQLALISLCKRRKRLWGIVV